MSLSPAITNLTCTASALQVHFAAGCSADYPALWLLDNDPRQRDPHSGQRLLDVADLPAAPQIRGARFDGGQVVVSWQHEQPDSRFEAAWLAREAHRTRTGAARPVSLWPQGASREARRDCAWLSLADLAAAPGADRAGGPVADWFERLCADGLAFLDGVGSSEGAILEAAGCIGVVQETNYGRLFDVRATARAENLAYTDLGLGLHTDNPYRDPVPGFQALHCLVAAPEGGENLFADGFALAAALREADPTAFALLAGTPVQFAYRARTAVLQAAQPLIRLDAHGAIAAVHYNSRSIEPLPPSWPGLGEFYAAYRQFAALLRDPRFQMRARLAPGEMVVFDNWRILHARTSFRGARHLQGCYLTRDSVFSHCALLQRAFQGDAVR